MTFREEFPSLKGKGKMIEGFHTNKVFYDFDIEENCLDKQKVIDAIDKFIKSCFYENGGTIFPAYTSDCTAYNAEYSKLKGELGLK